VLKCHHLESQGVGWARARANELYDGEELLFQIDSHQRFAPGWDVSLREDYAAIQELSARPILTTYLSAFEADKPGYQQIPCVMTPVEFTQDKLLVCHPKFIHNYETKTRPIRARLISGHFLLAHGSFTYTVPYDPDMVYGGYTEETTLSARAYTAGYDFYSPHRSYCWHDYSRRNRAKLWEDHTEDRKREQKISATWFERDVLSKNKTRQTMGQEDHGFDLGKYALNTARSLRDYEEFIGVDFRRCLIQDYTTQSHEPPRPPDWLNQNYWRS
jgi:hypothetical protein